MSQSHTQKGSSPTTNGSPPVDGSMPPTSLALRELPPILPALGSPHDAADLQDVLGRFRVPVWHERDHALERLVSRRDTRLRLRYELRVVEEQDVRDMEQRPQGEGERVQRDTHRLLVALKLEADKVLRLPESAHHVVD